MRGPFSKGVAYGVSRLLSVTFTGNDSEVVRCHLVPTVYLCVWFDVSVEGKSKETPIEDIRTRRLTGKGLSGNLTPYVRGGPDLRLSLSCRSV